MRELLDKRLILVLGKGGVGRTTVATAIARGLAQRGRKTLLFQANAKDRVGTLFASHELGADITRLEDNLYGVNPTPADALEEYGLMVLRFKRIYRLLFENRVSKHFLRAIPGVADYALLGKAWYHTTESKRGRDIWDTVVFDMPASGHSLSLLQIPWVILDSVPEGPLTRDAKHIVDLLKDSRRTLVTMVTQAEEMPTNEAADLRDRLKDQLGLDVHQLYVNQVFGDRFPTGSAPARALEQMLAAESLSSSQLIPFYEHSRLYRDRRDLNRRYLEQLETRFPILQRVLPMLFRKTLQLDDISKLGEQLFAETT